jgi:hypothetical protein
MIPMRVWSDNISSDFWAKKLKRKRPKLCQQACGNKHQSLAKILQEEGTLIDTEAVCGMGCPRGGPWCAAKAIMVSRTGCIFRGAQCKMQMRGSFFKNQWISRQQQQKLKEAWAPLRTGPVQLRVSKAEDWGWDPISAWSTLSVHCLVDSFNFVYTSDCLDLQPSPVLTIHFWLFVSPIIWKWARLKNRHHRILLFFKPSK